MTNEAETRRLAAMLFHPSTTEPPEPAPPEQPSAPIIQGQADTPEPMSARAANRLANGDLNNLFNN